MFFVFVNPWSILIGESNLRSSDESCIRIGEPILSVFASTCTSVDLVGGAKYIYIHLCVAVDLDVVLELRLWEYADV